jgi:hypothetical protein
MDNTARLYSCLRCYSQIIICRHCDRGNLYCIDCAPKAGKDAKNRAASRYQASHLGRLKHAARQRRYRERLKHKVTHKGSCGLSIRDLLIEKREKAKNSESWPRAAVPPSILCHSCHSLCSQFLRGTFLHNTA